MVKYIDDRREVYGVESICKVLPIAPSTYYEQKAREDDWIRLPPRRRHDDFLRVEIRRVWEENLQVYGARKVWHQLNRDGIPVARCLRRLRVHRRAPNACHGPSRSRTGQQSENNDRESSRSTPTGSGQARVQCESSERVVGSRFQFRCAWSPRCRWKRYLGAGACLEYIYQEQGGEK